MITPEQAASVGEIALSWEIDEQRFAMEMRSETVKITIEAEVGPDGSLDELPVLVACVPGALENCWEMMQDEDEEESSGD